MPIKDRKTYHARRATEARACAEAAQDPSIAAIHRAMAEEYQRLAEGDSASLSVVEE